MNLRAFNTTWVIFGNIFKGLDFLQPNVKGFAKKYEALCHVGKSMRCIEIHDCRLLKQASTYIRAGEWFEMH